MTLEVATPELVTHERDEDARRLALPPHEPASAPGSVAASSRGSLRAEADSSDGAGASSAGRLSSPPERASSPPRPRPSQLSWVPPPPEPGDRPFELSDWVGRETVLTRHLGDVDAAAAEAIARRVLEQFESDPPDPASFPSMASQVIDLIESPEVDIHELIRVVGQDPAISAKILKVANSAWYRRPTEIEELRPAVLLLGLKEVANLAIGVAGRALFDVEARAEFALFAERWHRLYLDAMANAFAASWLCGELAVGRPDRAFLGGMFHDIGKTVALRTLSTLMIRGRLQSRVPDAVVDRVLEDVHIDLGVSLLAAWQLPEYLTNICLRHHDPRVPEVPDYADLHVVRVVSTLSLLRGGEADANLPLDPLQQSLSALRMTREQTRKLYAHMLELTARLESTLGVGR